MANVSVRELQLFQLDILKELNRICRKCGIKYTLAYGSCLGAVRHHGFIPWDDDIDVQMTIDDYNKFTEACKTELDDRFYFQSHEKNPQTYIYWNRIGVKNSTSLNLNMRNVHTEWGICIDIFPIFLASEARLNEVKRDIRLLDLLSQKYYHINTIRQAQGSQKFKKMVHKLLPDRVNLALFRGCLHRLSLLQGDETIALLSTARSIADEFQKSFFDETIDLSFEDTCLPCVRNYDLYLKKLYGDYRKVPDVIETHTGGDDMLVILDEPYTNYLE